MTLRLKEAPNPVIFRAVRTLGLVNVACVRVRASGARPQLIALRIFFGLLCPLTLHEDPSRIAAFHDCGYEFPAIRPKFVEPLYDDVRSRTVDMNHFDFVFPLHRRHLSTAAETSGHGAMRLKCWRLPFAWGRTYKRSEPKAKRNQLLHARTSLREVGGLLV
jgi:hypothetical protein